MFVDAATATSCGTRSAQSTNATCPERLPACENCTKGIPVVDERSTRTPINETDTSFVEPKNCTSGNAADGRNKQFSEMVAAVMLVLDEPNTAAKFPGRVDTLG